MALQINDYFNITSGDISELAIKVVDNFNCVLSDNSDKLYKGFLLSTSKKGNALTVCDVDFQKSATDSKYQPRLIFRKTFKDLRDKRTRSDARFVRIPFRSGQDGYREFWKMTAFLFNWKHLIEVGSFEDSYSVVDSDAYILKLKNNKEAEKIEEIRKLINKGDVNDDIIRQARAESRKIVIDEFKKLLELKNYWKNYQKDNKHEMKGEGEEAVWHHFLKKHKWIIGLNVDVCFIRDLLDEAELGTPNTSGTGSPEADFLGISDYTILVELKTPNTKVFSDKKESTSRANTWSFSDYFIDGVSQCLAQKTDWEKNHRQKNIVDENGEVVNQDLRRTVDPNSIFLIGNKSLEIPENSRKEAVITKRETLQRFRRNNRNVDIITYDELYERAYFIVYDRRPEPLSFKDEQ